MSQNNLSGNFFISLASFLWLSAQIFFCICWIKITWKLIFEVSNSFLNGLRKIFLVELPRKPNNLRNQQKNQIKAKKSNFHEKPSEFTNTHYHNILFQVFDHLKNAMKRRG